MDWSKGYSASYYATIVDPKTWRDIERIKITGGTIKRSPTGLRGSASLDATDDIDGIEKYIRVYMDTQQDGEYGHEALFTGLATSPKRDAYTTLNDRSIDCYSSLKPADDIILERGWYAMAGSSGGEIIRDLLSATPAPVEVDDNSPVLNTTITAEDNETPLSMADKIATAMNWRIWIRGDGVIRVTPFSATPVATFDVIEYDVCEAPLTIKEDWYSCPNVFKAVSGDMTGIARDDDPDSPLSTVRRGREVWMVDNNVTLSSYESVAEYAARALKDAQRIQKSVSYQRRFVPEVFPSTVVRLRYPAQGVDGDFLVTSQTINLGFCAETSETVVASVRYEEEEKREPAVIYLIDADDNYIVDSEGDKFIFVE